jgi:hypothetical protein
VIQELAVAFRHRIQGRAARTSLLLAMVLVVTAATSAASAQGLLDFLFGGFRNPPPSPPRTAYGDPSGPGDQPAPSGRSVAMCVRTCDGRFFPLPRGSATVAQTCSALCPASRTKVFFGSEIDHAVAADGARYADMDNAFVYRARLVPGCTCNGKDAFGLARVDVAIDPTLQPGDVVATPGGLMAYTGQSRARRGAAGVTSAEFTPIKSYSGLSADLRDRLANVAVAPGR